MDKESLKLFCVITFIFLSVSGLFDLIWRFFGEMAFLNVAFAAIVVYLLFALTIFAKSILPKKQ